MFCQSEAFIIDRDDLREAIVAKDQLRKGYMAFFSIWSPSLYSEKVVSKVEEVVQEMFISACLP